jgi:hypothetical protein
VTAEIAFNRDDSRERKHILVGMTKNILQRIFWLALLMLLPEHELKGQFSIFYGLSKSRPDLSGIESYMVENGIRDFSLGYRWNLNCGGYKLDKNPSGAYVKVGRLSFTALEYWGLINEDKKDSKYGFYLARLLTEVSYDFYFIRVPRISPFVGCAAGFYATKMRLPQYPNGDINEDTYGFDGTLRGGVEFDVLSFSGGTFSLRVEGGYKKDEALSEYLILHKNSALGAPYWGISIGIWFPPK